MRRRDFTALYDFLFAVPDRNIRWRKPEEVSNMIDDREFFIAMAPDEGIVGACYLQDPSEGQAEWELGGAYTRIEYRTRSCFAYSAPSALETCFR
jgi:hypothetical protein